MSFLNRITKEDVSLAIIEPPTFQLLLSTNKEEPINVKQLILPHIICWHPLMQLPMFKSLNVCPVDGCVEPLTFQAWIDGSNKGLQPRLLHDMHHIILLGVEQVIKLIKDCRAYTQEDISEADILDNQKLISSILQPYPTNDIIARCVIIEFQKNEAMYCADMASKMVGKCLRLDHTFKVAANIGYLRLDKSGLLNMVVCL